MLNNNRYSLKDQKVEIRLEDSGTHILLNERNGYMQETQHTQQTVTRLAQNQHIETLLM